MTPLLLLKRDRNCKRCNLSATCKSICIPTRLHTKGPPGTDQCLVVFGEAPGTREDEQDSGFVGPSGQLLDYMYIAGSLAPTVADVYVGNVVRCHPPGNADPSVRQRNACRPYWQADLDYLSKRYRRVLVLAAGSVASQVIVGRGLTDQLRFQACEIDAQRWPNVKLIATYHPAALLRDPAKERPTFYHLEAVAEYLLDGAVREEVMPAIEFCPMWTQGWDRVLSFDLETYGCLQSAPPQTVFDPRRMAQVDNVLPGDMIVCASIAWRNPSGALHTGYFDWRSAEHRRVFGEWLGNTDVLLGQNIKYDLRLVRYVLGKAALPAWSCALRDLMIESFIYDDLQPERSLKSMSWLYRVTDYSQEKAPVRAYRDHDDPKLPPYACKDAWATLRGIELVDNWTAERYSHHPVASSKCSQFRHDWSSDQLWTALLAEEQGFAFDRKELDRLHAEKSLELKGLLKEARNQYDIPIAGKGSNKALAALVTEAIGLLGEDARQDTPTGARLADALDHLGTTKKKGEIATDRKNRMVLTGLLSCDDPDQHRCAQQFHLFSEAATLKKLVGSYTSSLLFGKTKKKKGQPDRSESLVHPHVSRSRFAPEILVGYPSLYLVPSSREGTGPAGGQRQYRWSFKSPALQTFPPIIKHLIVSQWWPGVMGWWDMKQGEWRVAMWLSGDTRGLQEIAQGIDIHSRSAEFLLGHRFKDCPDWINSADGRRTLGAAPDLEMRKQHNLYLAGKYDPSDRKGMSFVELARKWLRQNGGKSQNFAELYGGVGPVIHATTRIKCGIDIELERCYEFTEWMASLYPQRAAYRADSVARVKADGALHLPLLGQSRTFCDDPTMVGLYVPQIYDFPIQCITSTILQAVSMAAQRTFVEHRMKTRVVINWYDALATDGPAGEWDDTAEIVSNCIKSTAYLEALVAYVGRPHPLGWDAEPPQFYPLTKEAKP